MNNSKPTVLRPELLSFEALCVDGQHVLKINMHTPDRGTFILPATPTQAEFIASSLMSYVEQVGALATVDAK